MNITGQDVLAAIPDIVQIAILYFAIYAILKAARGSRFGQLLMGVGILFALLIAFTYLLHFDVLASIVKMLLFYLAVSSVVIFQPEIRRILATIGSLLFADNLRHRGTGAQKAVTPEALVDIVFRLAKRKMGALIAIERGISLRSVEAAGGVELDALISPELVFSIFTEPLPLHDGGVIIRRGRLAAAHCTFPVSSNQDGLSTTGMRHRAAVGLSEETDALVIVVSEETGRISIARNGQLYRYPTLDNEARKGIFRWVRKAMPMQKTPLDFVREWLRQRHDRLSAAGQEVRQ